MEREGKESRGVYLQKNVLVFGGIFFVITIVVVALLSHYLTPTTCGQRSIDEKLEETGSTPAPSPQPLKDVRLPKALHPIHYQLLLRPHLGNFTFYGHVVIEIRCVESTDVITLHSNNLTLRNESIGLSSADDSFPEIKFYEFDVKRQFIHFRLNGNLKASRVYNLSLQFDGTLNDKLVGLYRSKYGEDRWMATTQFEPTDARRAFPCFDEPAMKAKFTVTLERPKELMSISNMPQANKISTEDNWVKDEYQTTPNMSTYLLAFIVTNFSDTFNKSQGGIEFRVYARHEAINQTQFAAEFGPAVLDFYDDFFGIKYPLPKQDMIAIPDFGAGAMENWGLITYRETALLFDEELSSVLNKERVAAVIAHELAHQWFGNLVSPSWWDYLWLNEGFAAYMQNFAVDQLYKPWKLMERFSMTMQSVLKDDSLKSSHPVYVPVENPDQINQIFDSISYQKGASIIRMMVHFLGDNVFKDGLKAYFEDKKYGNAVQDDLWKHMTKAAERDSSANAIDVKNVMDTWTVQTGYPVVMVKKNVGDQSVTLTQKIFQLIPEQKNDKNGDKWEIPITYATKSNANFDDTKATKWIKKQESSITLSKNDGIPSGNEWIIFNVQQTGYYRVNYENDNWELITNQLLTDHKVIHVLNRAQLIDDSFNLARAGLLNYEIALNLTNFLVREDELVPWQSATSNFGYIYAMLSRTPAYGDWQKYLAKLVSAHYKKLKFNPISIADDAHVNIIKQTLFVTQACSLNLEDCVKLSTEIYDNWVSNPTVNKLPPSLRDIILCKAVAKGGIKEWDYVWNQYKASNVGSEKVSFLSALTCTEEPWIISKMLNMILDSHPDVRSQDSPVIAAGIAGNKVGRYLLFDFVRGNLKKLTEKYPGAFILSKIIKVALLNLNTPFELKQLKQFVDENKAELLQVDRTIKQSVEQTESNVMWMSQNYDKIEKWLTAHSN